MIKLSCGYVYHGDETTDYICDDRDVYENMRIIRSMSDEEFEHFRKELNELEEKYKKAQ